MAESPQVGGLRWRVEECKKYDRERQDLLDELLLKLQNTTDELARVQLDWEADASERRRLQQENKELMAKLTARPYVTFIIDADGYPFRRLNEGANGGKQIADVLVAQMNEHIRNLGQDINQCDILVEGFAHTNGLGQALVTHGQTRSIDDLRAFSTGFVCRQPMFSFVDVGRGKENADQKIRERVEFHSRVWQCKQVFLACCHDEGYAVFLEKFVSTGKITLVKNRVCNPMIQTLGFPFVEFPGVFAEPLMSKVAATTMVVEQGFQNPFALQLRLGPILHDKKSGLRYDRTLKIEPEALKTMDRSKLCFWFYLKGECKGCDRLHEPGRRLTTDEFDALWVIARRGECYRSRKGKACDDVLCVYGHKVRVAGKES